MKCVQCGDPADLHISWLAKRSENESHPDECDICSACLAPLWSKFSHTQFGQTLQIEGI